MHRNEVVLSDEWRDWRKWRSRCQGQQGCPLAAVLHPRPMWQDDSLVVVESVPMHIECDVKGRLGVLSALPEGKRLSYCRVSMNDNIYFLFFLPGVALLLASLQKGADYPHREQAWGWIHIKILNKCDYPRR